MFGPTLYSSLPISPQHTHISQVLVKSWRRVSICGLQVGFKNKGRIFGGGFQQAEGEKRTTHKVQDSTSLCKSHFWLIAQICIAQRETNRQPRRSRGSLSSDPSEWNTGAQESRTSSPDPAHAYFTYFLQKSHVHTHKEQFMLPKKESNKTDSKGDTG